MERKISGFRTAMEQASDISSINSNEFLEPGHSYGEVFYDLYGMADSGLEHSVNKDNLYMDGIYMKSFQFAHYSKGIRTFGDNTLFALCGPALGADDTGLAATGIMDMIDGIRPMLCRLSTESGAEVIQDFVQNKLPGTNEHNMAFGAIYATPEGVAAIATGGAAVYRLKGNRLLPMGGSRQNKECYLGHRINADCEITPLKKEETYVICSPVIAQEVANETMAETVSNLSPEDAVRKIMDKAVTLCRGQNISMMIIRISPADNKEKSKIKVKPAVWISAILAVIVIALAVVFGTGMIKTDTDNSNTSSGETLEEFNRNKEDKLRAESMLAELEASLINSDTALQNYKEVLAKCEEGGLNTGSDSQKAAYARLNDEVYSLNQELDKLKNGIQKAKETSEKGSEMLSNTEKLKTISDGVGERLVQIEEASKAAVDAMNQKRQSSTPSINSGTSGGTKRKTIGGGSRTGGTSGGGTSSGGGSLSSGSGAASGLSD